MADFNAVAKQFVEFYYNTFDTNRNQLAALYRPQSMLTWEDSQFQGTESIVTKLTSLPFEKIQHKVSTVDAQPTLPEGNITVMVTGALMFDDSPQPMSYVQLFSLQQESGSYFVFNDMFRLVYPASG